MFTIEYYTSETDGSIFFHKTKIGAALAVLDDIVYHKEVGIKRVSSWRVDFRNGDFVRVYEIEDQDEKRYEG
jgi:hypothetical protein